MIFWADRMHRVNPNSQYHDVIERIAYNLLLGSINPEGDKFYYQNPLRSCRERTSWHSCPCCTGNIPRTLLGLKDQLYSRDRTNGTLYINHYMENEACLYDNLKITQKTEYPWKGNVRIILHPTTSYDCAIKLRIPNRTESSLYTAKPNLTGQYSLRINGKPIEAVVKNGYVEVNSKWKPGDVIELSLPMDVQRMYCDKRVVTNRGHVAFQRGPIVYNFEDADHPNGVGTMAVGPNVQVSTQWQDYLFGGIMVLKSDDQPILAIPNYVRLNRGGCSQVWMLESPDLSGNENVSKKKQTNK
jgi:hypothetical protein